MANNAKWFVVHTYSGYENKVASNIKTVVENRGMQDEILDVLYLTEKVKEIKDGKEREVERKLFPGYVLVKAETYKKKEKVKTAAKTKSSDGFDEYEGDYEEIITMSDEAWYVIRNTRGVTGFVGPDGTPSPLSDEELVSLGLADKVETESEDEDIIGGDDDFLDIFNVKVEVRYSVGSQVNIIDGQFEGKSGVVKSIDLVKEEVVVNIPFMGRETPTHLKLHQVELA